MQIYPCLASVAQLEFDALVQDAHRVIEGLDRQRQSATQAIEATQRASEQAGPQSLETAMVELELVEKLHRLEAALDHVKNEIEAITASPSTVYHLPLPGLNAAQ